MLLIAYENRGINEPGVRLLVDSLFAIAPDACLRLHFNVPDAAFASWAGQYPGLDLRPAMLPTDLGWNIKPSLLLEALDDGEEEVAWLDADLIVTGDFLSAFRDIAPDCLIATEEALWGNREDRGSLRACGWGFEPGRQLPFVINSCVVRVTPHHRSLLAEWARLLESEPYRAAQALPWYKRPAHMVSDQDVLTALLGSAGYRDVPLHILRRGEGILQAFGLPGFTLAERMLVRRQGLPFFVHAQGPKPWLEEPASWLQRAYRDSSPYVLSAVATGHPAEAPAWTRPRTALGGFLRLVGFGRLWLTGLPLAALFDAVRFARRSVRRLVARR